MARSTIRLVHVNTEALSWSFFVGQGTYMKARGIEFHAVSSPGEYLEQFAASEEVTAHAVEISRAIAPLKDLRSLYHLWRRLRLIRPAIVEAHTSKAGIIGMIAGWMARIPIRIYHNHGMALLSESGFQRSLLWWCEKIACLLAHEVIYVAESVRDAAVSEGLCPRLKTRVISSINGLDAAERFNPRKVGEHARAEIRRKHGIPADALVIGFVGRIFWVKGVPELAIAWTQVSKLSDSLHLLVVGEVDSRVPMSAEVVNQLRSDPRIHLAGYIEDIPPYYAAMDVLVLPSHYEGLGYVLLEA
ncbi:MAG: glycosyltransferase family 1 protein, partial [Nitrospira sp. WS110]|nr:glycosyltransferase family 1 protein [Nitrospira sp. WS110]